MFLDGVFNDDIFKVIGDVYSSYTFRGNNVAIFASFIILGLYILNTFFKFFQN